QQRRRYGESTVRRGAIDPLQRAVEVPEPTEVVVRWRGALRPPQKWIGENWRRPAAALYQSDPVARGVDAQRRRRVSRHPEDAVDRPSAAAPTHRFVDVVGLRLEQ